MTRITKKMHEAGVKRLNEFFGWAAADATSPRGGGKKGKARRVARLARQERRRQHGA